MFYHQRTQEKLGRKFNVESLMIIRQNACKEIKRKNKLSSISEFGQLSA